MNFDRKSGAGDNRLRRKVWQPGVARPAVAPARHPDERRHSLAYVAYSILLLAGVYLDVGTKLAGVPMLSALPAVLIGLIVFARRMVSSTALSAYGLTFAVYLWSLLATSPNEFLMARTLAFGQFMYSVTFGLILFFVVTSYSRRAIVRFLDVVLIIYLVLLALEVFTPLYRISDAALTAFYGHTEDVIAGVIVRDNEIGLGLRRPKLFLSETSFVAVMFTVALGIRVFLATDGRILRNIIVGIVGVVLIRSPISVVGLLFVLTAWGIQQTQRSDIVIRALVLVLAGALCIGAVMLLQATVFGGRVNYAESGVDYSVTYRTYGSLAVALAIAREHPIFGVGLGSIDVAYETITQTYLRLHIPRESVEAEWRQQIQNLPAALIVYIGAIGTLIFVPAVLAYCRYVSGRLRYFFWLLMVMLAASNAAFYSPKFQTFLFLFLAVNLVYNRSEQVAFGARLKEQGGLAARRERLKAQDRARLNRRRPQSSPEPLTPGDHRALDAEPAGHRHQDASEQRNAEQE